MDHLDQERAEKREQILNAAQQVFAEKGFHSAKVETIAERAAVAKGTVYLYFTSKKELLTALIEDRMARLHRLIQHEMTKPHDYLQLLHEVVRAHFAFYQEEKEFVTLLYGQLGQIADGIEGPSKQAYDTLSALVSTILGEGIEKGILRPANIRTLSQALEGMINAVAFDWVISLSAASPQDLADDVFSFFCRGAVVQQP